MIISNAPQISKLSDGFDWSHLEKWQHRFCCLQRVGYVYEPFATMYVDSFHSLQHAMHAIEEEALMYMVNESNRGRTVEMQDLIPDNDLVIISKNTTSNFVKEYECSSVCCWLRLFEHQGDLYQDADIILRPQCKLQHYLEINPKIPIAFNIAIEGETSGENDIGQPAWISAAIVHSEADKLEFQEQTVHLLKRDKKASTLDILLGIQ